jgi:hypothetical protein
MNIQYPLTTTPSGDLKLTDSDSRISQIWYLIDELAPGLLFRTLPSAIALAEIDLAARSVDSDAEVGFSESDRGEINCQISLGTDTQTINI